MTNPLSAASCPRRMDILSLSRFCWNHSSWFRDVLKPADPIFANALRYDTFLEERGTSNLVKFQLSFKASSRDPRESLKHQPRHLFAQPCRCKQTQLR